MKYSVRVTDVATGKVQVLDVEASSEEEAIRMFDASSCTVSIISPDEIQQAHLERLERLRQEGAALERAQANGGLPLLVIFAVVVALVLSLLVGGGLDSSTKKSSGDQKGSKMTDAEKALYFKILTDR